MNNNNQQPKNENVQQIKKSDGNPMIFSLKNQVHGLVRALKIFEVKNDLSINNKILKLISLLFRNLISMYVTLNQENLVEGIQSLKFMLISIAMTRIK